MKHSKEGLSSSKVKVGITGGIGSGKSIIGKVLTVLGYPVYYSDQEAKILMNEDKSLRNELVLLFGKKAYINNQLNRSFLAEQIFQDPLLKEKMNGLIHPKVRQRFNNWVDQQTSDIVFNEAAILFETGSYKTMDYTILVTADERIRVKRVQERDGLAENEILARMNNQWKDEQKIPLADFVIDNNPNVFLFEQIQDVLSLIAEKAGFHLIEK